MRMDFETIKTQVDIENIADYLMGEPVRGMHYFPGEKTGSIKIYPKTQSWFDFGRCCGGDGVFLWAHVRGISNGEALREICETFGIDRSCDNEDIRKKVEERKAEQRERENMKKFKQRLWRDKVDDLKNRLDRDNTLLEGHAKPFTDVWKWSLEDKQLVEYKLDILCGIE